MFLSRFPILFSLSLYLLFSKDCSFLSFILSKWEVKKTNKKKTRKTNNQPSARNTEIQFNLCIAVDLRTGCFSSFPESTTETICLHASNVSIIFVTLRKNQNQKKNWWFVCESFSKWFTTSREKMIWHVRGLIVHTIHFCTKYLNEEK